MAGKRGGIAVVGAAGFLGTALVAAAEARSDLPVCAYTRAAPFLSADGSADRHLAEAATVYWLASSINPALAESHPHRVRADQELFEALLRALRQLADPPRVVLLSSGGTVYDSSAAPPYRESSPTAPRSAYGRAKLAMEVGLTGSRLPTGRSVTVRAANVYGPGQPAVSGQGVVGYWLRAAADGGQLQVYGDPGTTRDYVYIDDVVDALLRLHALPDADVPAVVNVGSGAPTALSELADTLLEVVARPGLQWTREPSRGFDVPHTWLDVTVARESLRWVPSTTLWDGLAMSWASLRSASASDPASDPGDHPASDPASDPGDHVRERRSR